MNKDLNVLEDLFIRLQGSQIVEYSYNKNILRLQLQATVANYLLPGSQHFHLVLEGCSHLFFLSYSQTQENRVPIDKTGDIFSKGLMIQGIELRNRESSVVMSKDGFIIYCNSYLNMVEAGELHLKANAFQLYDQEFGRVSYSEFCKASDLLKSN